MRNERMRLFRFNVHECYVANLNHVNEKTTGGDPIHTRHFPCPQALNITSFAESKVGMPLAADHRRETHTHEQM